MKKRTIFLIALLIGFGLGMLLSISLLRPLLNRSDSEVKRLEYQLLKKKATNVGLRRSLKEVTSSSKSWVLARRSRDLRCNTIIDLEVSSMRGQIKELQKSSKKYNKVFGKLENIYGGVK